jgi:hypothetical protein
MPAFKAQSPVGRAIVALKPMRVRSWQSMALRITGQMLRSGKIAKQAKKGRCAR